MKLIEFAVKVIKHISKYIRDKFRSARNVKLRRKLKNDTPTIICNNCVAGIMYHDLGLKFFSPTINLSFFPDDYLKFTNNLKHYCTYPVIEDTDSDKSFPVGIIDDIRVYFMHYESFSEAKAKWEERCKRINYDNCFFMISSFKDDNWTNEHFEKFLNASEGNRIVFVNKPFENSDYYIYIKGFEKEKGVGHIMRYMKPMIFAKRYYEQFDYVSFLNGDYNHN